MTEEHGSLKLKPNTERTEGQEDEDEDVPAIIHMGNVHGRPYHELTKRLAFVNNTGCAVRLEALEVDSFDGTEAPVACHPLRGADRATAKNNGQSQSKLDVLDTQGFMAVTVSTDLEPGSHAYSFTVVAEKLSYEGKPKGAQVAPLTVIVQLDVIGLELQVKNASIYAPYRTYYASTGRLHSDVIDFGEVQANSQQPRTVDLMLYNPCPVPLALDLSTIDPIYIVPDCAYRDKTTSQATLELPSKETRTIGVQLDTRSHRWKGGAFASCDQRNSLQEKYRELLIKMAVAQDQAQAVGRKGKGDQHFYSSIPIQGEVVVQRTIVSEDDRLHTDISEGEWSQSLVDIALGPAEAGRLCETAFYIINGAESSRTFRIEIDYYAQGVLRIARKSGELKAKSTERIPVVVNIEKAYLTTQARVTSKSFSVYTGQTAASASGAATVASSKITVRAKIATGTVDLEAVPRPRIGIKLVSPLLDEKGGDMSKGRLRVPVCVRLKNRGTVECTVVRVTDLRGDKLTMVNGGVRIGGMTTNYMGNPRAGEAEVTFKAQVHDLRQEQKFTLWTTATSFEKLEVTCDVDVRTPQLRFSRDVVTRPPPLLEFVQVEKARSKESWSCTFLVQNFGQCDEAPLLKYHRLQQTFPAHLEISVTPEPLEANATTAARREHDAPQKIFDLKQYDVAAQRPQHRWAFSSKAKSDVKIAYIVFRALTEVSATPEGGHQYAEFDAKANVVEGKAGIKETDRFHVLPVILSDSKLLIDGLPAANDSFGVVPLPLFSLAGSSDSTQSQALPLIALVATLSRFKGGRFDADFAGKATVDLAGIKDEILRAH
eukprot:7388547-Prymnesium_polylepis.1